METQKFIVSITFTNSVANRKHLKEIVQNIVDALEGQVDGMGLAPEDAEALTMGFSASSFDIPEVQASKVVYTPAQPK